jgi:hypothetical protein
VRGGRLRRGPASREGRCAEGRCAAGGFAEGGPLRGKAASREGRFAEGASRGPASREGRFAEGHWHEALRAKPKQTLDARIAVAHSRRGGGTGRRMGLKIPSPKGRTGSIPVPGTGARMSRCVPFRVSGPPRSGLPRSGPSAKPPSREAGPRGEAALSWPREGTLEFIQTPAEVRPAILLGRDRLRQLLLLQLQLLLAHLV